MAAYTISSANLDVLEENLGYVAAGLSNMADNLSNVTGYVSTVDKKVEDVSTSMESLRETILKFMTDSKNMTIVTNAKQSIMLTNQELDKKFAHHDEIRRQVIGILQSTDIEVVKKDTLDNLAEQVVIKAPNYWLGRAMVALVAWINDNRDLANRALDESIKLDDEKTSLLFFLICMRIKRIKPALIWFNRYISMQDPSKMESKIVNVIDSMVSGIYGLDAKKTLLNNIQKWQMELNSKAGINDVPLNKWFKFFEQRKNDIYVDSNLFPYLSQSSSWSIIKENLVFANLHQNIYNYFNEIFDKKETFVLNKNDQIDNMLNDLVFNYDNEELDLRKEVFKNKLIIEENGDVSKAYLRLEQEGSKFNKYNDFYLHVTNIAMYPEMYNCLVTTRKFVIAFSKKWIVDAYQRVNNNDVDNLHDISIKIADWEGITKDGSNEKKLRMSLSNHVDNMFHDELYQHKYLDTKSIIGFVLIIIGVISALMFSSIGLVLSLFGVILVGLDCYQTYNDRTIKLKKINDIKNNLFIILSNNIAEIVEYRQICKNSINDYQKLINYLNSLAFEQFMLTNSDSHERKVIINE